MKTCSKCGRELFDEAVICPGCGCPVDSAELDKISNTTATRTKGSYLVGLMIALVGIAVSVAASFLTLFHLGKIAEMTAMDGDFKIGSIVAFAILAVVLVTILIRDGGAKGYCFVGGLAVLGEAFIHYLYVTQRLSRINVLWINLGDAVKMDIGFYLMLAGGVLLMIAGFFMPSLTKKRGVVIMAVVVGALILAGIVVTFLVNSDGGSKKDEATAKNDDVLFINDVMNKAEMVAVDWEVDVGAGTSFTISLNNGKVSLSCSDSKAQTSWESRVSDISHSMSLESSAFGEINGSIIGKVQKDGNLTWIGNGVSALTTYSSTLSKRIGK